MKFCSEWSNGESDIYKMVVIKFFCAFPVHAWAYLCVLRCWEKALDVFSDVGTESATKTPLSPPRPLRHDSGRGKGDDVSSLEPPQLFTVKPLRSKQEDQCICFSATVLKIGSSPKTHIREAKPKRAPPLPSVSGGGFLLDSLKQTAPGADVLSSLTALKTRLWW